IGQEDHSLNDMVQAHATRLKNGSKIFQNPLCPDCYVPVDQLSRRRVQRNLTGTKYERTGSDTLSVRADRGRGFASGDHRFHESVEGYPAEGKCQLVTTWRRGLARNFCRRWVFMRGTGSVPSHFSLVAEAGMISRTARRPSLPKMNKFPIPEEEVT